MPVAQFSGLASGIDSAALIDAIIEARETTNLIRKKEIDHLESENDSLDELNTKILALNDLVDQFRSVNGGGISKKATSSDSTTVTAMAGSNAINSSFSVSVTTLAKAGTFSFNQAYSSESDVVHATNSGAIDITVGEGDDEVTISTSVTAGDTTVQELVDDINNDAAASGRISASLVNVGTDASPSYRIVLNTIHEGTQKGYIGVTTSVLADSTSSQATNATFSLSGINGTITRDSNTVSDVVNGVTFQLLKSSSSATISVGNDSDTTADLMNEIVEAYNDIVEYVNENDTITRVEDDASDDADNVYGSLAKTNIDNDFLASFRSYLSEAESANGTSVKSMAEIGISTNRDGTLSFDVDDFKNAIGEDSLGVQEVISDFADSAAGVTGFMYDYTKLNGLIDIAKSANDSEIDAINDAIEQLTRSTDKQRTMLEQRFMKLESTMSSLQSQQAQLTSVLSSL